MQNNIYASFRFVALEKLFETIHMFHNYRLYALFQSRIYIYISHVSPDVLPFPLVTLF